MYLGINLMLYTGEGGFVPGTVPKVISSIIPHPGNGIKVVFDRPMTMTKNLHDAISVIVNGAPAVHPDHIERDPQNPGNLGFIFPAGFFKHGDVVTWAYNDQHPTEELKGAEPGGKEIDNQTYGAINHADGPALSDWVDEHNAHWADANHHTWTTV